MKLAVVGSYSTVPDCCVFGKSRGIPGVVGVHPHHSTHLLSTKKDRMFDQAWFIVNMEIPKKTTKKKTPASPVQEVVKGKRL